MIIILKWVHIAICNTKRNFLGVNHKINGENLFKNSIIDILSQYLKSLWKQVFILTDNLMSNQKIKNR